MEENLGHWEVDVLNLAVDQSDLIIEAVVRDNLSVFHSTRDQCSRQRPRSSLLHDASRASNILVCNKGAQAKRDKATREEGTLSRERRWGLDCIIPCSVDDTCNTIGTH